MAGDWLKLEASTPDKAEVMAITAAMGWDDPDLAVGKLFRVWRWFDQQTTDGNAPGVTSALLDRVAGVTGFASAMQKVGWLVISEGGLTLPNFDRHNGKTAKARALTARRVNDFKAGNATGNAPNVTAALPREEKRREETKSKDPRPKPKAPDALRFHDDSIEMRAAKYLFGRMLANNPEAKEPNWQAWAGDFDRILRIDGRDKDELRAIIDWCQADPFWLKNVLSPSNIRKQYERLKLAMQNPKKPAPQRREEGIRGVAL